MERYDFTQPGGFPFDQNILKDMQEQYLTMMQKLCANFGAGPYIISGMVQAGGNISDGWFFYNGDLVSFTGGVIPVPGGGSVVLVQITNDTGTLAFDDGTNPVVKISPRAALTVGATVTDATHFPLTSLLTFPSSFATMIKDAEVHHAISAAGATITGDIYQRNDFLNKTVRFRGELEIHAGIASSGVYNILNTGVTPPSNAPFIGVVDNGIFTIDSSGKDYVATVPFYVDAAGNLQASVLKTGTNYFISINAIIPLD
jgi:hypothetical protein